MPTQVQKRPSPMTRASSDKYNDCDPANKNAQHKEALRLALGSILTPKRPYTPSSRSSSGTASPAHPSSFPAPSSPPLPPPPHPTPIHTHDTGRASESYLHPRHIRLPHTPSRLGLLDSQDSEQSCTPNTSPPMSAVLSPTGSQRPSPSQESPPPLNLPAAALPDPRPRTHEGRPHGIPAVHAHAPTPSPTSEPAIVSNAPCMDVDSGSGSGTPKAKFLETLQSKSAWDALIHGSFS